MPRTFAVFTGAVPDELVAASRIAVIVTVPRFLTVKVVPPASMSTIVGSDEINRYVGFTIGTPAAAAATTGENDVVETGSRNEPPVSVAAEIAPIVIVALPVVPPPPLLGPVTTFSHVANNTLESAATVANSRRSWRRVCIIPGKTYPPAT